MTDQALKAAVDPYLFERLDAILVEEDRMHPIGCSSWEEEARIAVDMAKDTIRTLLAALSSQAEDTARMDWLEGKTVNVRDPLVYGSRDLFWATPDRSVEGEEGPSDIRARIDAARTLGDRHDD